VRERKEDREKRDTNKRERETERETERDRDRERKHARKLPRFDILEYYIDIELLCENTHRLNETHTHTFTHCSA
jgi:hypothetical protein